MRTARLHRSPRAFSLVEVIVVLAIILAIVAILMPVLGNMRLQVRVVECQAKLRRTMMSSLAFSMDHYKRLPATDRNEGGGPSSLVGPEEWQRAYMGTEAWPNVPLGYEGVLVPYLDLKAVNEKLYRCPDLETGVQRSGQGSNGWFDYVMFAGMSGAYLSTIPSLAEFTYPGTGQVVQAPCIVYTEEHPGFYVNRYNIDPGHSNIDVMGAWHMRGRLGNYAAVDGSVNSLEFDPGIAALAEDWSNADIQANVGHVTHPYLPTTWNWRARGPSSGEMKALTGFWDYGEWTYQ